MKNTKTLPENYREILSVDLQNNKKLAILVNGGAFIVMALMIALGALTNGFNIDEIIGNPTRIVSSVAIVIFGSVLYIVLHELTHGVFIRIFSGEGAKYGFTGMYAYAGSDYYFAKLPYIIIALAPVIFWGTVLLILNLTLPSWLFWPVYYIQITNISGAAGDAYVTVKFMKLPKEILVRDSGIAMVVYSAE